MVLTLRRAGRFTLAEPVAKGRSEPEAETRAVGVRAGDRALLAARGNCDFSFLTIIIIIAATTQRRARSEETCSSNT